MVSNYVVSKELKQLLRHFAAVVVTVAHYAEHRPAGEVIEPDKNFGLDVRLQGGEPALLVRINSGGHDIRDATSEEAKALGATDEGQVKVMSLPEDEFWFFEGFRPALSGLWLGPPAFLHEMAFINLYAVFEGYLSDVLRRRLHRHPKMMADDQQLKYQDIFEALDKAALLDRMVEREVRNTMYKAVDSVLDALRARYGMKKLGASWDDGVKQLALLRNCLLHNGGLTDARLSEAAPHRAIGSRIEVEASDLSRASTILRKLAHEIDRADQGFATEREPLT